MSEFRLQNIVVTILNNLGSKLEPEEVVEFLQKNMTQNATSGCSGLQIVEQSQIQNLIDRLSQAEPFLAKYNDLKQKNVDSLNLFVQLLNSISHNPGVKDMLASSKKNQFPSSKTSITKDNMPQVKHILKEKARKSQINDISTLTSILNLSPLPIASTPSVMSWVQRKPNMSLDFSTTSFASCSVAVPEVSQESILIEDLLNVLIGLPGCYIEAEELKDPYGPRTFRINDNVPLSLQELVKQILPLASHYSMIQRFTEEKMRFEFGQVNNALAEAMQSLIKEHMLFVVQLETEARIGSLSLQRLWFFTQRNMQCLGIAADIAFSISKSDAKGGKVLSLLHDNVISSIGDERNQQLCLKLMEAACVPYMKMLGMWIHSGIISDPINEFLVEDCEKIQKEEMPVDYSAEYWDRKYSVRRDRIPKFLESVSDIILKAGKYLNVIRQCGKLVKTKAYPIEYKIEEKHYIEAIEKAYKFASQTLLDLVIKEKDLIGRLRSVKHYFLLDKGDFIVTFLTLCEKELNKQLVDVVQGRLESLMDLALRLSSAVNDPYKEDLNTELLPFNLQYQMFKILSIQTNLENDYWSNIQPKALSVIESFSFSYEVRWPLSLILNKKSLACYQMLFRHLFYSKYVERLLCQVWKSNKVAKKFHCQAAKHYREAFVLRQKMLHCVQNLEYHMMVEVIEPHWCLFLQKINKVQNVDEILACHCDFLDNCLKDCMLTIPAILITVVDILNICVEFAKFMQRMQRYFVEAELGSLPNSLYESFTQNEVVLESGAEDELNMSFKDSIMHYDIRFLKAIGTLLSQINDLNRDTSEHDRLFNLLYRLNFNTFYTGGNIIGNSSG
ncbi:gamma-tubulin complex component 2-like isoform X1 [Anthonomus grandis grandis]|uniref:gamma-tubulin complex component 2-like isoform X1 n=1 Tax=Anthonomus grandis grandis TaxID=2921223 RepID=UPI0021653B5C|nr:gamma-tubulin complex component 2-like isoform X1 [Anthonomus grandis grandis]